MNKCRSCGGTLEYGRVTQAEEFSGQIAIMENVPARVCKQCGDGLFRPEVVEKIQQLVWSSAPPTRMVYVPVYNLAGAPPVEESKPDLMAIRENLHRLVDKLPEEERHTARRFLEFVRNMGASHLTAPEEAPERGIAGNPAKLSESEEAWRLHLQGEIESAKPPPVKDILHRLTDELADEDLRPAKRLLEYLRDMSDPVLRSMMEAPIDDEPVTPEEEAAIREAYEELAAGRLVSFEELRREFGL